MNMRRLFLALLTGASLSAEVGAETPRLPPTDVEVIPYCGTERAKRLDPKQPGMFRELEVTATDKIHIHGRKQHDSGRVDEHVVYHLGKAALIAPEQWKGRLAAKLGTKKDVRYYYAVLDLADKLVSRISF